MRGRLTCSLGVAGLGRGGSPGRGEPYPPAYPSPLPDPGGDSLSASGITWERGGAAPGPVPSPLPARDCSGPAPRGSQARPSSGHGEPRPRPHARAPGERGERRDLPEPSVLQGMGSVAPGWLHHPDRLRSGCAATGLPGRAAVGAHRAAQAARPPQPGAALQSGGAISRPGTGGDGDPAALPGPPRGSRGYLAPSGSGWSSARSPGAGLERGGRPRLTTAAVSGPRRAGPGSYGRRGGRGPGPLKPDCSGTGGGPGRCPGRGPGRGPGPRAAQGRGSARPLSAAARGKRRRAGPEEPSGRREHREAAEPGPRLTETLNMHEGYKICLG